MKAATEAEVKVADDTTTPVVSDERREEISDELADLDKRQHRVNEAQEIALNELASIEEERRELVDELLADFVQPDALELTPAMADEAINALKVEFDKGADEKREAGYVTQEGMDFAVVEAKLRAVENEEQLKAIYRMVMAGSRPAVVREENGRYCIAETFVQTLPARANCVYDRKAERQIGKERCNGNAVTQSQKMGVPLMERRIAKAHMVEYPYNDECYFDYIQATPKQRKNDRAPCINRDSGGEYLNFAYSNADTVGWRGALWV